jgi:hypothetical protein
MARRSKPIHEQIEMELERLATSVEDDTPEFTEPEVVESEPVSKPESTETTLNDILESMDRAFIDLPFRCSFFEMTKFNIAAKSTPARAYAYIGEQLFEWLGSYFQEKKNYFEAEIRNKNFTTLLESEDMTEKEKARVSHDLDVAMINFYRTKHQMNEALQMVSFLYNQYLKFPKITRQEFEDEEFEHFKNTLMLENKYERKLMDLMTINTGVLDKNLNNFIAKKIAAVQ